MIYSIHRLHSQKSGRRTRRGNLHATKARQDQNLDTVVTLMMAIGLAMAEDEQAKGWIEFPSNATFG